MRFRPCIDIHNGKVKQIVGGSLSDRGDQAAENFVSEMDGAYYADFYKKDGLKGGHIILLNPASSPYYEATKQQALLALGAYPGGFQLGGGITPDNAKAFLDAGASHVIVTSYVFRDGKISTDNLRRMLDCVGKEHLVLDLSCRKKDGAYYVVTDRWQKFTETKVTEETLEWLRDSCAEFLIHAVELLADMDDFPCTYAGGVGSFEDLARLKQAGRGKVDVTIGSALDLFGGKMPYREVLEYIKKAAD